MKILFIGGTGIISTACTALAASRGVEVTLLTRGQRASQLPGGVKTLIADANDPGLIAKLDGEMFDAVVDWIAFTPADIERDLKLFRGRTRQFVFISSASAYQKPQTHYLIDESTPLANPYWDYSRNKIACEERLLAAYRDEGFPVTIVRPSLTYGETLIPLVLNSWDRSYTAVDRMIRGQKLIVPGDGTSLWVITHNSDFAKGLVGLLGNRQTIGHAFHITSDEVLTWDQMFRIVGNAVGVDPHLVHISSDFIAACLPEKKGTLIGDKSVSVVFDNSKIKRFVPEYRATTSFADGIRRSLAWFNADAARRQVDSRVNAAMDKLIGLYERGMSDAVRSFQ
ncbi:MAG TPA: SDR family oxidoreductase [Terriglobales bacterium]|jgi:nucleoside-diphosphate-sugar epimerase|nr:SDR family oxidoreductase [Terriglobales bacterium]